MDCGRVVHQAVRLQMTKRSAEPFTVMAKPVGPRCNLACSYCYYLETEGMYGGELSPKMSDGLLETYIRNYIEASPGPGVVRRHGGSRFGGLDFYRKAVELQNATSRPAGAAGTTCRRTVSP